MEFFTEVVLVEEALAEARNTDINFLWISPFSLYLAQCSMPSRSFQLGSRPGMSSVRIGFKE